MLKNVSETFQAAFDDFMYGVTKMVHAEYSKSDGGMGTTIGLPEMSFEDGRRYVRIVKTWCGSRSAFCFIDKTNGDILKTHTWKAPAKHSRGNILADDRSG